MPSKRKKIITGIFVGILLAAAIAVTVIFFKPILNLAINPQEFRDFVNAHPFASEFAYIGMVMMQIIFAFLPGEPLEIVAGFAFGAVKGTILCILASTLGSMAVFVLVKSLGKKIVTVFFSEDKLKEVSFLKTTPGRDMLYFIIFLIPGTPKDLLCYFAGLTDMKWYVWLIICSIGRIPSIITSTLGGSALGDKNYFTGILILVITLVASVIGLLVYQIIVQKKRDDANEARLAAGETIEEPPETFLSKFIKSKNVSHVAAWSIIIAEFLIILFMCFLVFGK
ncbi:MAG: TVP38/TMEM64 family protein [Clostridia bacterium]|nr:TVP38/TMEM64 family protein [Clostridia bacterium]